MQKLKAYNMYHLAIMCNGLLVRKHLYELFVYEYDKSCPMFSKLPKPFFTTSHQYYILRYQVLEKKLNTMTFIDQ